LLATDNFSRGFLKPPQHIPVTIVKAIGFPDMAKKAQTFMVPDI